MIARKMLLGYVVGIIWPADGGEWLFRKGDLCSLRYGSTESNPTLYPTQAAAEARKEQIGWNELIYRKFVRPYYRTT